MIGWRKDKHGDRWQLFGPASELHVGKVVVTKKSGATQNIECVGVSRPFDVDGVPHVYGFVKEREKKEPQSDGRPAGDTEDIPF